MAEQSGQSPVLTNRQGHPISNNQDQRTVGARGPATLENYQFLEKITHFDRERVPERVVHARGFMAHGHFEAYGTIGDEPASRYTRAKLFQEKGKRTPVSVRLSTVIGGRDSSESARDPRGFAVKFRTEDGNWDLVGNNLPVFFIRDAIKFPDVVHAFKPDPVTFRQDPNRIFDFCTLQPSSLHLLTMLMTTRGIPRNYRLMNGFGVNTYRMVNAQGEGMLVKYHWRSQQGVDGMTAAEAAEQQGKDLGHASKDCFDAIERGEFPKWELCVQIMEDQEHPELDFDPLDATKTWPHAQFPLRPVGMMTLDNNVKNFFLENEQIAFGTGVLVDGLDFSDDKLLVGRTFSYSDTQRHRIGPNYLQLPVNRPAVPVHTNQRDANMAYDSDGKGFNPHVNYEPSQLDGTVEARPVHPDYQPFISGNLVRASIERRDDWRQPGILYTKLTERDRVDLITNLVGELRNCDGGIQQRAVAHFARCHPEYGQKVAAGLGIDIDTIDTLTKIR
jgi:catalase